MRILSCQRNSKYVFYITMNQLWKLLGMINENYKNITLEELNKQIPDYEITSFEMNKFYQRCNQRLREILYSSLNNLKSRCLIKYEIETVIVCKNFSNKEMHNVATDIQKKHILNAERMILKEFGLESKRHVFAKFKDKEFYSRLNEYLYKQYGWEYTFNRIKIIYNKEDVIGAVSADEVKLQRMVLNQRIIEALNINAQKMVDNRTIKSDEEYKEAIKQLESHWIGEIPSSEMLSKKDLKIFEYPPYFVEIQKEMTDKLISIRNQKKRSTIIEINDSEATELDELFGVS